MADVNTKFIASPSFMIQSVGKQTITVQWRPRMEIATVSPFKGKYTGFCDWPILGFTAATMGSSDDQTSRFSPLSVSLQPSLSLRGTMTTDDTDTGGFDLPLSGNFFFGLFLGENPIHCTKINVRASDALALPSTLEILTPNSFSGQFDRQIVNILADTNMYQNQSNIVTLDCDFYVARNSILRVDSSFNENAEPTLAFDMTFDKYLSVEKALVENYELLQTADGMANAIQSEIAAVNAKVPAVTVSKDTGTVAAVQMSKDTPSLGKLNPWKPTFGSLKK